VFTLQEITMLFSNKTESATVQADARTTDTGKVVLGGGFRLPASVADAGKIRLGGGFRLPVRKA
jgi:hypothetical protein